MLSQLPTELKIIIVKNVDRQTLPSLLRVSWVFHDIGQPVLYHTVTLGPFDGGSTALKRAIRCLHALATKASIREAIQDFRVWTANPKWPGVEEDVVNEFSQALHAVVPKLPNVVKVAFYGENWAPIRLQLSGHSLFQSVQHYSGPPEVLENIESPFLRSVHIMGSDDYETIHRALLKTSQSCGTTLRVVRIFTDISYREWENLLGEFTMLFPNLVTLDVSPIRLSNNERVDKISEIIRRLKHLRLLEILQLSRLDMDRQRRLVNRLHAGSPQLRAIRLRHEPWCFSERLREWLMEVIPCPWKQAHTHPDPEAWREAHYEQYLTDPAHEGFQFLFSG